MCSVCKGSKKDLIKAHTSIYNLITITSYSARVLLLTILNTTVAMYTI
jgi:hypothetical protein